MMSKMPFRVSPLLMTKLLKQASNDLILYFEVDFSHLSMFSSSEEFTESPFSLSEFTDFDVNFLTIALSKI